MDALFQALIDAIQSAHDYHDVRGAVNRFAVTAGFNLFAYLFVSGSRTAAFSDYPLPWQQVYLDRNYAAVDPVVTTAARQRGEMFTWSADDPLVRRGSRAVRRFHDEAADFGIRSGVSIPIITAYGGRAMLTLASDRRTAELPLLRDPTRATVALAYIHIRLHDIASGALARGSVWLSRQEAACLTWCSLGKKTNETADFLNIRPRTVQGYLDNARKKLGADNVQHAVRIAIEKKLI